MKKEQKGKDQYKISTIKLTKIMSIMQTQTGNEIKITMGNKTHDNENEQTPEQSKTVQQLQDKIDSVIMEANQN